MKYAWIEGNRDQYSVTRIVPGSWNVRTGVLPVEKSATE